MPSAQATESHQQPTGNIPENMDENVPNNKHSPFPNDAYQVGWISALPIELAAARGMLDEEHGNPQTLPQKTDNNSYVLGQIHNHKVVIACLPRGEVGASSAALVAQNMMWSFPNIRIGLMVGIGAGIPRCSGNEEDDSDDDDEQDVHLGDVIISSDKKTGGVVAYNFGKKLADGSFEVAYHLDQPPRVLRTTLAKLEATHETQDNLIPKYIGQMLVKLPGKMRTKWMHPGLEKDILFPPDYMHASGKTCKNCDQQRALRKGLDKREDDTPVIHYGVIATGSEVVRHAPTRDQIRSDHNAICLEMEAAGLMNNFPCLVIRGISDYADSHKNDRWHRYAAAAAAACAKELLSVAQPLEVQENPRAVELVGLLDKIDSKLDKVDTKISTFITASQAEKLRKWLSASNPETNFKAALGTYHPGTCLWFLEGDRFKDWKLASRQSLWMHGIPGSGKTVMSSKIIDNLLSEEAGVLYFFFDTRDSEKQSLDDLLRSLILQLYEGQSRNILESLFVDRFGEGNKRLFSKDLETTFLSMISSSGRKFKIVLDALDECSTKEDVLDWVQSSDSKAELAEVGFLITSRNDKVIESGFKKWLNQDCFVPLETEAINKDLTGYIEFCLQSRRYFERWSNHPGVLLKMKQELVHRADGMFRLAVCQLEILKSCIDIGQVEDEIKRLPRTLEEVYERILRDIREHHHTRVVRILQFLVYSQRPLRIDELVDAIAVDLSREPAFELGRRMPDPQGILEMCPSLLASRKLNAEDNNQGNKTAVVIEVVELAHATVKEYLVSLGSGSKFYSIADPVRAQGIITTVCLAYLSQIDEKETQEKTVAQFYLAQFSSRYWLQYAKGSDEILEVREATIRFLSDERTRHIWGSLYNPDFPTTDTTGPYKMATPLYYASLAGLAHTVTKLLQMGADPMNADGGEYGNSLQAACAAGQEEVVKILLLERGVDVNRAAGSLGNALQAASTQNNEKVIKMLLEKGAQLQAKGGKYGTALQAASARGNHGVVRLLLDKGASPNLLGGKYNSALYVACLRGHEQIVRFLLDRGADSNAESPERGIPLQAATEGNHTSIIQMLLSNGAQINKKSGLYGCTLQLACVRGREQVVSVLLDKGADPNQAGGLFGSPLQAASARGDVSLVRLLLEKGANPNAWGGYYNTSIQAASSNGYVKVIKLLIDGGADVNAHDRADEYSYGPSRYLDDAIRREPSNAPVAKEDALREERLWAEKLATMETNELQEEGLLVKQLLAHESKPKQKQDEDPSEQGIRYVTLEVPQERFEQILLRRLKKNGLRDEIHSNALQTASAQGWTEAVALLLEAGADTNTCQGIYGNPLQASSARGHAQIVKLLIDNGANPNKLGGFYGTALQAASARGHDQVVSILLDNWADPRREGGAFDASLPAAAARGHIRVVEILLQHPSYLNPEETMFQRALYSASAGAYIDIVRLLLERGADMDVEEQWYIGALQIAAKLGHFEIAKMLLEYGAGINVPIIGDQDECPLYVALIRGNADLVRLFIEAGADLNTGKETSNTPLCAAAKSGHAEMIRLLIDHGAELISSADYARSSPELLGAVTNGHEEVVALLLELGAKPDGFTLEAACDGKHETILRMLVRSPAILTAVGDEMFNRMTYNPLRVAARIGDGNLLRILLEAGLFPRPGALQEASARGDIEMVKLLLQAGSGIDEQYSEHGSALQAASKLGNLDLLCLLIEEKADVNSFGGEFGTALQAAVNSGHDHIIDALLKAGADINIEGGCRGSALQAAANNGNEKFVETLLGLGCQTINTNRGKYGNALQAASKQGHLGIVRLLLDHGADVNTTGGKYGTALRAAVRKGHLQVTEFLLDSGAVVDIETRNRRYLPRHSFSWGGSSGANTLDTWEDHIGDGGIDGLFPINPADSDGDICETHIPVQSHEMGRESSQDTFLSTPHAIAIEETLGPDPSPNDQGGDDPEDGNEEVEGLESKLEWFYSEILDEDCMWERRERGQREYRQDDEISWPNEVTNSTLKLAALSGNELLIQPLLDAGAILMEVDFHEMFATTQDHTIKDGIIERLVSAGADHEILGQAVIVAARNGDETSLNRLVQWAATHGVKTSYNEALPEAARHGNERLVKILLENGADPNAELSFRDSAFFVALESGHESLCLLLLDAGADVFSPYVDVFQKAALKDFRQLMPALLSVDMGPDKRKESYNSALRTAARLGKGCIMDIVIDMAEKYSISLQYSAALTSAANGGNENAAKLLINKGAQLNLGDRVDNGEMICIIDTGDEYLAKLLLGSCSQFTKQKETDVYILHLAARKGFTRIVSMLLENGLDPEGPSSEYQNVFEAAAAGGHSDMLDLLLGFSGFKDEYSGIALRSACRYGSPRMVEKILKTDVDVNSQDGKYGTALYTASTRGHRRIVKMLIKAGADVNGKNATFGSALQGSAARGHVRIAECLLENGARIMIEDENGRNTLQAAARGSHIRVVDLLLRYGADLDPKAGQWGGAIQAAASAGSLKTIKFLLTRGADVNAMGGRDGSALHIAAYLDKNRTVELLLDEGASPDAIWHRHGTPLHAAIATKHFGIARKLVDRGANVNIQGGLYGNALQALAVVGSYYSFAEDLIEHGADSNSVGGEFGCALQAAAKFSPRLFKLLLKRGADPNIQGGEYGNPLQAACSSGRKKTIKMLIKAGAEVNSQGGRFESSLIAACMSGSRKNVEVLLDHGADVNLYLQDGQLGSPLHAACFAENKEIVELLLSRGADVNFQFGQHGSALQVSCMNRRRDIVEVLLDKGASTNAKGGKLGGALQAASWAGDVEIVKMVLGHGAEVNLSGGFFEDALQSASSGSVLPAGQADPLAHFKAIRDAEGLRRRPDSDGSASPCSSSATDENPFSPHPTRRGSEHTEYEYEYHPRHHAEVIQLLLDNGARIQSEGGHFGNALQAAVVSGDESLVEKLIDAGADVNAKGGEYGTSLVAAATCGLMPIVKQLLDAGADINLQSTSYGTALISATSKSHNDIVGLLLERSANVNAKKQETKETALAVATKQGHDEIIKMLLDAGADVNRLGEASSAAH